MLSSEKKQFTENSNITPIIISKEGNIGSGKSTFVQELKQSKLYPNSKVCFLLEPVNEWNKITDNQETIIEKYYKDQKAYAFQFQMMAYISRLKQIKNAVKAKYDIIITERSVMSDKNVFAKMLYEDGNIKGGEKFSMQLRLIHQDLDLKNDNKYLSYEDDKLTRLENYFEDLYENSPVRILDKSSKSKKRRPRGRSTSGFSISSLRNIHSSASSNYQRPIATRGDKMLKLLHKRYCQ